MAASMGPIMQFGCDPSSTTASEKYKFRNPALSFNELLDNQEGIRGTREETSERTVQNTRAPRYSLRLFPNAVELDTWLTRIMWGAESVDVWNFSDTQPAGFVSVFDLVTARWYLTGCQVDKATFSWEQGGPLALDLEVEALDFSTDATVFPTLSFSLVPHYIASENVLVHNAATLKFRSGRIMIDNLLKKDRFLNSQTRISLPSMGRKTLWEVSGPYGDNSALFGLAATGVACTQTFTKSGRSTLFSAGAVHFPREFPQPQERDEIMLPLVGECRKVSTTGSLIVTNDSAP